MKSSIQIFLFLGLTLVTLDTYAKSRDDLARIFVPGMLTADLAYLEHMVGPAKRTEGNDKEYVINGCKVTVTSANGSIRSLALELSPKCTVDLNKFLRNTTAKFPSVNKMTFGQFEAVQDGKGQFMSECLDCGNSMDPIVSEFWIGSHADGVLEVELSVTLVSTNAIDASFV